MWPFKPKMSVVEREGLTVVTIGKRQIVTTSPERAHRYKRGIDRRIAKLLAAYYVNSIAPVRQGDLVVNVGANIGEVSVGLSQLGARVLAIEPDPLCLRCLKSNATGGIEIVPFGLWKNDQDLTFYQRPESADTSAINKVGEPFVVPARKLDTIMYDRKDRVALILGDAEGAEPEVLEGATETLRRTNFVSLDVSPEREGKSTREACSEILTASGFEILQVPSEARLVARFRN